MSFAITLLPVSSISHLNVVQRSTLLKTAARYGVYATVFLYKAKCTGAFQNDVQRQEVVELVLRFIAVMKEAPSVETHICHDYSRMLRQLWRGPEAPHASSQTTRPSSSTNMSRSGQVELGDPGESTGLPLESSPEPHRTDQDSPSWYWEGLENTSLYFTTGTLGQENDLAACPIIEAHPFGSFWPGITDFWGQSEVQNNSWEQQNSSANGFYAL